MVVLLVGFSDYWDKFYKLFVGMVIGDIQVEVLVVLTFFMFGVR